MQYDHLGPFSEKVERALDCVAFTFGTASINCIPMIQKNREVLFVLIRGYHEQPVSEKFPNKTLNSLAADLHRTQERVISMMLRFVQGKDEFTDWRPSLEVLAGKIKAFTGKTPADVAFAQLLMGKVAELVAMVVLAQKFVVPVATT